MVDSFEQFGLRVISGKDRSPFAAILRGGLRVIEPFYACAMRMRNACYDRGIFRVHDLGRPTISVGNITTGGTGKTPVVQWLATQLRSRGHRPAILLRGYGSSAAHPSDEAQLLDLALNKTEVDAPQSPGCLHPGKMTPMIPVMANPSRIEGATRVLSNHPGITHFILDDGFQHRKAKRDFNLVLISATEPFGFGHVLPRGLLREPLSGLARANAFLITRSSLVNGDTLTAIEERLKISHPNIPIFRCDHEQKSVYLPQTDETISMSGLRDRRVFLTAGIGDPLAFERQISRAGAVIAGSRWWPDHHRTTAEEITALTTAAEQAGATLLLTTAKDWVKLRSLEPRFAVGVVHVEITFATGHEQMLLSLMLAG